MQINIENFRCFHKNQSVGVRPLNLLIGENSAGKTSFLAAIRLLFDIFDKNETASFNKNPFYLGAFENISHYRGGRFGRASSFSFEVKGEMRWRDIRRDQVDLFSDYSDEYYPNSFRLKINFCKKKSQPSISDVEFSSGKFRAEVVFSEAVSVTVSTPSVERYSYVDDFSLVNSEDNMNLSNFGMMIRYAEFQKNISDENKDRAFTGEIRSLYKVYLNALNSLPENIYASAPVRTRPERTYNPTDSIQSPDGGHIPYVLAELSYFDVRKWRGIKEHLDEFGRLSGLFKEVAVKKVGASAGGPFQIIIDRLHGGKSNLMDVGYGVSQALPIIADTLRAPKNTMFLFQQPEVHLHPRAQAELGSFFAKLIKLKRHTLFVETHSEYLIDRIRMAVRDGVDIKPEDVSILYFHRKGHDVKINTINFDEMGNLIDAPPGYRDFFLNEEMRSLGIDF
ncbi:AAA family ATPase [Thalassospiraceae bacterium SW-3-3]|nr:AAA family ATPase [Thalassospiraceae bacterium SW-3-3]